MLYIVLNLHWEQVVLRVTQLNSAVILLKIASVPMTKHRDLAPTTTFKFHKRKIY